MVKTPLKTRYPIESFGPDLMELLLKGGRERVEVKLESAAAAKRLQARLHTLRARMREARHHNWNIVARARTQRPKDRPGVLVVQPHDEEFAKAIQAAGITPVELPKEADVLAEFNPPPSDAPIDPLTSPSSEKDT